MSKIEKYNLFTEQIKNNQHKKICAIGSKRDESTWFLKPYEC